MSFRIIRLLDIGEGVTEAEIVEWQIAVGDRIEEDQILGAVMTDKAAVDIPSPVSGVIHSLGGEKGDVLAVGAELAKVKLDASSESVGNGGNVKSGIKDVATGVGEAVTEQAVHAEGEHNADKTDEGSSEKNKSADESTNESTDDTSATDRQALSNDRQTPVRVLAAPAVRRRATELAVDMNTIKGTGIDGRITHSDLDNYLFDSPVKGAHVHPGLDTTEEIPVLGVRRKIARKMEVASRRIPHFSYIEELDVTELESLRLAMNNDRERERERVDSKEDNDGVHHADGSKSQQKLTPLPFIVLAIIRSLNEFPEINARYDDEKDIVVRHRGRHVGIATQTAQGLLVTVVKHAESLGIWALASDISRLASAARDGSIRREELEGSTITVTSLGALGGVASTPIINHPEVAIVGVNRIVSRVVMHEEKISSRLMMNLSSSFDHRIIDGHQAALFIQRIRRYIEHPVTLFIDD